MIDRLDQLAFIGFGEAGAAFAAPMVSSGQGTPSAHDRKGVAAKACDFAAAGVRGAATNGDAVARATLVLSLTFQGAILRDPRLPRLRRLAWIWSAENMLLALAVYHRLAIYIGFNGLTYMRMVGLFGTTAVVLGFAVVVVKVVRGYDFGWVIRWELAALALVMYVFAVTPVDAIVHRYNVRRIVSGDVAAALPMCVLEIDSEGMLCLLPLLDSANPTVRDGTKALFALRESAAEALSNRRRTLGWTSFQWADRRLLETMRAHADRWADFTNDNDKCVSALNRLRALADG